MSLPRVDPLLVPADLVARLPDLMRAAIIAARAAEHPFGCVVADWSTGHELFVASNSSASDSTAHAEINGLREVARRGLHPRDLVLISTAEPCPMCASASWWAEIRGVVFGTSIARLIQCGFRQINLPMTDLLKTTTGGRSPIVLGAFLTEETDLLYNKRP